jgi:hypothetical protein
MNPDPAPDAEEGYGNRPAQSRNMAGLRSERQPGRRDIGRRSSVSRNVLRPENARIAHNSLNER